MSKAITVIINKIAKPKGLDNSICVVGATANPVIDGSKNKKFARKTAEIIFNMNIDVFILFINIC